MERPWTVPAVCAVRRLSAVFRGCVTAWLFQGGGWGAPTFFNSASGVADRCAVAEGATEDAAKIAYIGMHMALAGASSEGGLDVLRRREGPQSWRPGEPDGLPPAHP
jgi:hypothetical protein